MSTAQWYDQPTWQPNKAKKPTHQPQPRRDHYYGAHGGSNGHSIAIGYLFWIFGFTGAHRFYYGKPLTGVIWFCTFGLLGVGWIVDAFLIPSMNQEANLQFRTGAYDYNVTWVLLILAGWWGAHRLYQAKIFTGLLFLMTGGLFGIGFVYDILTLNEQIDERNMEYHSTHGWQYA